MSWFYYGREISGAQEIRNLKTLRNNPKIREKYLKLGNAINIGTTILFGTFVVGVLILTGWLLSWAFQDGFNLWAILLNPITIIFMIVFLGTTAGRSR